MQPRSFPGSTPCQPIEECTMQLVTLEATTLPDAWFQALWHILKEGVPEYNIDRGS